MKNKKRYTTQEMNESADGYCQCLRLIEAGETSIINEKDSLGLNVLHMVEPFLLTYYLFMTGKKRTINSELKGFLRLFMDKDNINMDNIVFRIVTGMKPICYDCHDNDSTLETTSDAFGFKASELYCWFLDIIFGHVLPNYRIRYTNSGERINFFRAFQQMFRYEFARRVKEQISWNNRSISLDELMSVGADFQDMSYDSLYKRLDLTPLEWRYIICKLKTKNFMNTVINAKSRSKSENLVRTSILAKIEAYKTSLQE